MAEIFTVAGRQMAFMRCGECGIEFLMPEVKYRDCRQNPRNEWHCPNGHCRHFSESESDRLRRQIHLLKQREAMHEQEEGALRRRIDMERRQTAAYKGQVTRLKKRATAGLCPCCNRHFDNLQRHMATKHAGMDPEELPPELRVVDGGKSA